ncbi:MAG: Txe/YoeB family addiction module toxin [Bacteroidales bacterium]|nr:Txe/YoeB family addiction module toxin [Bacteroidales bacterium]
MNYNVVFSRLAAKDAKKIAQAGLKDKTIFLLEILQENPFKTPPPFEKLVGNLSGFYSRRINIRHRLVYEVFEDIKTVRVLRMWTHYD